LNFLSTHPNLSGLADHVDAVCDAISKSNSATVFINSGIEHLLGLQEGFEERRAVTRDLDVSLKQTSKKIAGLHKKLTSVQGSAEARRCRVAIREAVKDEEKFRVKFETEQSALEVHRAQYQKEYVQAIATLMSELSVTRSENEQETARMAKLMAECGATFSLGQAEPDENVQGELRELRKIVSATERDLSRQLFSWRSASDKDLIVVCQSRSIEVVKDESWEEDDFMAPTTTIPSTIALSQ
jgi:hypothetical protein